MKALETNASQRDLSRINALDYVLMTLGCCLAGYSGGMAISEQSISWFVVQWILIGSAISYAIRSIALKAKFIRVDGLLYGLVVVGTFVIRQDLQRIMPQGGFPFEVIAAGWLCWMLILGSFFTWQDSTLLFQAVPSIAMFGLVGCYDTFRDVIFLFFVFLLCLATLFTRAHHRQMLRQAADSGYFTRGLAPGTPIPEVETTPGLAAKMQEGPWRWIAGPEWAVGSALVVVMISLLGAPVIRQSTQGVSGFVKIPTPPVRRQTALPSVVQQNPSGEARIGRGPNRLTKTPVFEIQMSGLHYLRGNTYDSYLDRAWRFRARPPEGEDASDTNSAALDELMNGGTPEEVPFTIRLRQPLRILPLPGYLRGFDGIQPTTTSLPDGARQLSGGFLNSEITGTALAVPRGAQPKNAQTNLAPPYVNMLSLDGVSPRVQQLAREVAGDGTDYSKAERIRAEISRRIKYNINAAATPGGLDPIEHVLFEQKEAYCDVFASSMTVMARSVGIPARYVTGFLPGEENRDRNGRYVVLESDAHAWSELYFENVGWVIFDATSGAESVPGGERGAETDNRPWYQREWVQVLFDGLIVVALGAAVLYGLRAAGRLRGSRTRRDELNTAYVRFNRILEKAHGHRRDLSQTPYEFFAKAEGKLGSVQPRAQALNEAFVEALYGPDEITPEKLRELVTETQAVKKDLAAAGKNGR